MSSKSQSADIMPSTWCLVDGQEYCHSQGLLQHIGGRRSRCFRHLHRNHQHSRWCSEALRRSRPWTLLLRLWLRRTGPVRLEDLKRPKFYRNGSIRPSVRWPLRLILRWDFARMVATYWINIFWGDTGDQPLQLREPQPTEGKHLAYTITYRFRSTVQAPFSYSPGARVAA